MTPDKKIIYDMGQAGAGKSTFGALASLAGWNVIETGRGLKAIENFCYGIWAHFRDISDISTYYRIYVEPYYKTISLTDFQFLSNSMSAWYDNNELVIHNGNRRNALQYLGTDIMRNKYGSDIHIDGILNYIEHIHSYLWVIESVRFINEINAINQFSKSYGVVIERNDREYLPEKESNHASEQEWQNYVLDNESLITKISNDSSKIEFICKVANYIRSI
jgi:hypothetical protein